MMADIPMLYWWSGTCSRVTLVSLEEIGEPFELQLVDKIAGDDRDTGYRTVNPKGKVPAVRIDGRVLTETSASFVPGPAVPRSAAVAPVLGRRDPGAVADVVVRVLSSSRRDAPRLPALLQPAPRQPQIDPRRRPITDRGWALRDWRVNSRSGRGCSRSGP
jgi:hypothetical protein